MFHSTLNQLGLKTETGDTTTATESVVSITSSSSRFKVDRPVPPPESTISVLQPLPQRLDTNSQIQAVDNELRSLPIIEDDTSAADHQSQASSFKTEDKPQVKQCQLSTGHL